MIIRLIAASLLALALSSCVLLVDDTPDNPNSGTVVKPATPVTPQVVAPATGSYTYRCTGGTVVVNYLSSTQVRVFYDGGFQLLNLSKTSPTLVYSTTNYAWEWTGRVGNLSAGGRVVLSNCVL